MPKLRLTNKEVQEYILSVLKYWTKTAKIDGWRLDVANEIPHQFWIKAREELKLINSELLITGEIWYDSNKYLSSLEWDNAMNYPLYYSIKKWLVEKEYKVNDFANDLIKYRGNYQKESYHCLWNFVTLTTLLDFLI